MAYMAAWQRGRGGALPHRDGLNTWLGGDKAVAVPGRGAAAVRERRDTAVVDAGVSDAATAREVREGGREGGGKGRRIRQMQHFWRK